MFYLSLDIRDDRAMLIFLLPIWGLPWVFFTIADVAEDGGKMGGGEALGALLGGGLLLTPVASVMVGFPTAMLLKLLGFL